MPLLGTAIRKRTQISMANRLMFIWVAGVSVLLGASLVASIFLTQMLLFNERVLFQKAKTLSTLDKNNAAVKELKNNIRELDTNQALINSKAKPEDRAIQVVLDALPSEPNSLALGASLQNKLLGIVNGLTLETFRVDNVDVLGSQSGNSSVVDASNSSTDTQKEITFRFSVSGDEIALKKALVNLESSIRTIDITTLKIESKGKSRMLSVQGRAFYEPTRVMKLKDKVVR